MTELYWITRLDYINNCSGVVLLILFITSVILVLSYYISNGQMIYDDSRGYMQSAKESKGYKETCSKSLKIFIPITVIFSFLYILTPTTNEALLIYGVGNTIDYIKQNPIAQKLPDKCVNALDKWVDSWNEEKDSIRHK